MIRAKTISLFLLFAIPYFVRSEFIHNFKLESGNSNVNGIEAKISSIKMEEFHEFCTKKFRIRKELIWAAKELNNFRINPYVIEITNKTDTDITLKIDDWIFENNFFLGLKDNMFESMVIPNPIVSAILFLITLTLIEVTLQQNLSTENITQIKKIYTNFVCISVAGIYLGNFQYKINRNYKLKKILKNQKKKFVIKKEEKILIPVFVDKDKKELFEGIIKSHKPSFEGKTLTI